MGMNPDAVLLANRTDCEYNSTLNFDALLLGGYLCHVCLPEQYTNCEGDSDIGKNKKRLGYCSNVQWRGYTCNNEYYITKKTKKKNNDNKSEYVLTKTNDDIINTQTHKKLKR